MVFPVFSRVRGPRAVFDASDDVLLEYVINAAGIMQQCSSILLIALHASDASNTMVGI